MAASAVHGRRMRTAQLLDGHAIADDLRRALREQIAALGARPKLGILYCATPSSTVYKNAQLKQAAALQIDTDVQALPADASQADVERVIERWNVDPSVHGIFVHQPMPTGVEPQRISAVIDPRKDVEGLHPQHSVRRFFARERIGSCTALAVMELIERTGVALEGKEAVVVGHSEIVGRPVTMLLLDKLATTTVCHAGTHKAGQLQRHVERAEILVVAVGKPHVIPGAWIKPGAIVIDVGINVVRGHVVGDVDFADASARAGWITPVPGGVGPVTVMMVMKNTIEAMKLQREAPRDR